MSDKYILRSGAIDAIKRNSGTLYTREAEFLLQKVIFLLKNAPAADAAEVVHGKWDGDDCTVCKLPWNYNMVQDADDWGYFDPMPDYCPNCGAKMDGGNGDG